jgi:hypothetical protein
MGLLDTLGLPPRVPRAGNAATGGAGAPPAMRGPTVQSGPPKFKDWKQFDPPNLGEFDLTFPVTLNGKTRAQIEEAIEQTRLDFALSKGDYQRYYAGVNSAEQKVSPLAKKVETTMKVPAAKIAAEIRKHTDTATRHLGRDALNARNSLANAGTMIRLLRDLLEEARGQLDIAKQAIEAEGKRTEAATLKAQAEEIEGVFSALETLFDKAKEIDLDATAISDATLLGLGTQLLSWGVKALAGADRLREEAQKLEDEAKAIDSANLKKALSIFTDMSAKLARRLGEAQTVLNDNFSAFVQESSEAERAYDAGGKGQFRFGDFDAALQAGEASITVAKAGIDYIKSEVEGKARVAKWLGELMLVGGKCLSHHDHDPEYPDFKPDSARIAKETGEMKAIVKKGIAEVAAMKAELEKGLLALELEYGDITYRQQRWASYRQAAQTALFTAPEPAPPRRK